MIRIKFKEDDTQSYEKIYNFRTYFGLGRDDGEYSNMYVFTYSTYDCNDNVILITSDKKEPHNRMKMRYFISKNHLTFQGLQNDII